MGGIDPDTDALPKPPETGAPRLSAGSPLSCCEGFS